MHASPIFVVVRACVVLEICRKRESGVLHPRNDPGCMAVQLFSAAATEALRFCHLTNSGKSSPSWQAVGSVLDAVHPC